MPSQNTNGETDAVSSTDKSEQQDAYGTGVHLSSVSRRHLLQLVGMNVAAAPLLADNVDAHDIHGETNDSGVLTARSRDSEGSAISQPSDVPSLHPIATERLSARLLELTFENPLINPPLARTQVRILLPPDYATSSKTYPVIYLFHGTGGTSASWTTKTGGHESLQSFTADTNKDAVIVMPDGGRNEYAGWYSDWYNSGDLGPPHWETYHLRQLIPYIGNNFRVKNDRTGRVVAGLSMGGFGAMSYAARHPDLFAGAFSFSGAVDTPKMALLAILDLSMSDRVWGKYPTQEVRWRGHNPTDLAHNLSDVRVWFTTGKGLPGGPAPNDNNPGGLTLEAGAYVLNESFDRALNEANVDHTFEPYPQGGHNWWHWQEAFQRAWPYMVDAFEADPPRPSSFDYRSIEPSFTIWDWHVLTDREVTEFLYMTDVSTDGLRLRGSGAIDLVTPPAYEPERSYVISVEGETASVTPHVPTADSHGRLRFTVTLGPSHTDQQYTLQQEFAEKTDPNYWQKAQVTIQANT